MECISCGSIKLAQFLKIPNAPQFVERLLTVATVKNKKITLVLYKCGQCLLVQLPRKFYVQDEYYEDYLMSRTYSAFSRKYQSALAADFVKLFGLKKKSILEVGCGDGFFAKKLMNSGAKVLGIEPSKKAVLLAKKKHVPVLEKYVDDNLQLPKLFDAFTACQVFEHIIEPKILLNNIKRFMKPESFGLIEVPSLVKSLSDNRFYDFFPDHVAYYSPVSLSYLLTVNGFNVIDIRHTANNEYITAFFKRSSGNEVKIQDRFDQYRDSFESFFKKLSQKKIAIWGAGGKGVAVMSFSNISRENILFCIDSDPNKQGRFLNGNIKIVSPRELLNSRPEIIVITAMMYKDEIINSLVKDFGYEKSQIAVIAPTPKFITS